MLTFLDYFRILKKAVCLSFRSLQSAFFFFELGDKWPDGDMRMGKESISKVNLKFLGKISVMMIMRFT